MKRSILLFVALSCTFALTASGTPALQVSAPDLTWTASSRGTLIHDITGIPRGDTVRVERFADFNENGLVDPGEPILRAFTVTDGQRPTVAGAVNGSVAGDDDGAPNGSIRVLLDFRGASDMFNRQPGKYVYRLTSSAGVATLPFEIKPPSNARKIVGTVRNEANQPMANAMVVAFTFDDAPFGSVRADSMGRYEFFNPPNDCKLVAFADGYFASRSAVPLSSDTIISKDLTVQTADLLFDFIARVVEADSAVGVSGIFIMSEDLDGQMTGTFTGNDGAYHLSRASNVTPFIRSDIAADQGYLILKDPQNANPATMLYRPTALIHGHAKNNFSYPFEGIAVRAIGTSLAVSPTLPMGSAARTMGETGEYWLPVRAGTWRIEATDPGGRLVAAAITKTVSAGEVVEADVDLRFATAYIKGRVVDSRGAGVAGVQLVAQTTGDFPPSKGLTSSDGSFVIPVWAGTWTVHLNPPVSPQLIDHAVYLTVANQFDQTIQFVIPDATAQITGQVKNTAGELLAGVEVTAIALISNVEYATYGVTDLNGRYTLPVITGQWTVALNCNRLQTMNYDCPQAVTLTVNAADATADFIAQRFSGTYLVGRIVGPPGVAVGGLKLMAYPIAGGVARIGVSDPNGLFSINISAADWVLQLQDDPPVGTVGAVMPLIQVTEGQSVNNIQFKLTKTEAAIFGTITDSHSDPVSGIRISATGFTGLEQFRTAAVITDTHGHYSLPVSLANWLVDLDCQSLYSQGYECFSTLDTVTVQTVNGAQYSPTVISRSGEFRLTAPRLDAAATLTFTFNANPGTYDVEGSDTVDGIWRPIKTITIPSGATSFNVHIETGSFRFFRMKWRG